MGFRFGSRLLLLCCLATLLAEGVAAQESAARIDAEVWFVEGVVALQENRNEEAVASFKECLSLDPDEGTCRYFQGIGLLRLSKASEAALEIEKSLQSVHPPRVDRQRVLADLQKAQNAAQGGSVPSASELDVPEWRPWPLISDPRPPWERQVLLAAGVDSNPSMLSEDFRLPLPSGGLVDGSASDTLTVLGLEAVYYPEFLPEWSPGVQVKVRQSLHRDLQDLDLGQAELRVHLVRGRDPRGFVEGPLGSVRAPLGEGTFTFLLQGGAAHYQFGGEPYLSTVDLAASVTLRESAWTGTGLAAAWQDRDFSDDLTGARRLSGRDISFGVSQTFFLGGPDRSVGLELSRLERTAGRAEALSRLEASVRADVPVGLQWDFHLLAAWCEDRFDHPESRLFSETGPPREDDTWGGIAELGWSAKPKLSETPRYRLFLRGSWTERDSSVDLGPGLPDLGYQRTTASVGWEWRF